jgi:hypothetical protein
MSVLECLSSASGETSAFPRLELLGKSLSLPEFAIGDLVSEDWEAEDAEGVEYFATDFGEVLGLRWVSEAESWLPQNTWIYFVRWTHSTSDLFSYPTYDGEPNMGCDLKLIKRA